MKGTNFIYTIVKKIEETWPGVISYAYWDKTWWMVAVSDFDLYMSDKRFKTLTKAWHAAGKARGFKVIFCCCSPKEKRLADLASEDNLIMNI